MNEAWEALKNKSDKHAAGLLEAYEYQKYLAQYRDTMAWINGMKQLAGSDELGKSHYLKGLFSYCLFAVLKIIEAMECSVLLCIERNREKLVYL